MEEVLVVLWGKKVGECVCACVCVCACEFSIWFFCERCAVGGIWSPITKNLYGRGIRSHSHMPDMLPYAEGEKKTTTPKKPIKRGRRRYTVPILRGIPLNTGMLKYCTLYFNIRCLWTKRNGIVDFWLVVPSRPSIWQGYGTVWRVRRY